MPIRPAQTAKSPSPAVPTATGGAVYEFFAGGGLAGIGLEQAGLSVAMANDIDAMKADSFRRNHPDTLLHHGDIWTLNSDDLPGRPDVCWASSPCQDVSLAGARGGLDAPRSGAFWGFWRLIRQLDAEGRAPTVIVLENVAGLLTSGGGADFAAVCRAMVEGGYRIGALEMDAGLWLPQSRPRLFVVAMRGDAAEGLAEAAASGPFHSRRLIAAQARLPDDLRDAWAWWRVASPERRNLDFAAVLEPEEAADWLTDAEAAALLALTGPLHRRKLDEALAASAERRGERVVGAGFRRVRIENGVKQQRLELRFDGMAGCLRTPSGGSSRQYVVVCEAGRARVRRLTAREAARLMGLGDDYRLPNSQSAGLKLMGDAVAVPVVRALAEGLIVPALRSVQPGGGA